MSVKIMYMKGNYYNNNNYYHNNKKFFFLNLIFVHLTELFLFELRGHLYLSYRTAVGEA